MSRIVIAGSFDSKAAPFGLLIDLLRQGGEEPVVIDTAVYPGARDCTYSSQDVAARAGMAADDVAPLGRAKAVGVMAKGASLILSDLVSKGEVGALVCMGGSNAATIFSHLAPVLPLGIPKILMATVVAGDTRPFMGANDVVLIYPVVDVDGDNAILRQMIDRLAKTAMALKTMQTFAAAERAKPAVALTMFGVTTPLVQRVSRQVEEAGAEAFVFHANGTGGRTVEAFATQRVVDAVVDATLAELGNELLGGALPAGPDRLSNAAREGIPQVIVPGAIDMINFGPRATVPARFEGRLMQAHNDLVTLLRTTPEECRALGQRVAERLGAPTAGCTVCLPLGGTSMLDAPGGAFHDPTAVLAFKEGLIAHAAPGIRIVESPLHINHPDFADLVFAELQKLVSLGRQSEERAKKLED